MTELLTRPSDQAALPGPLGQANQPIGADELKARIRNGWNMCFGVGATELLCSIGIDLAAYGLLGKNIRERRALCEDLVRSLDGFFSASSERRLRLAICLGQVTKRLPELKGMPYDFARAVIEAARVKVDWRYVTDDASDVFPERMKALLPSLLDGSLGSTDGKADPSAWRKVIRDVVVDGKTVEELLAQSRIPAPAATVEPAPTVEPTTAAPQAEVSSHVEVTSTNVSGEKIVSPLHFAGDYLAHASPADLQLALGHALSLLATADEKRGLLDLLVNTCAELASALPAE